MAPKQHAAPSWSKALLLSNLALALCVHMVNSELSQGFPVNVGGNTSTSAIVSTNAITNGVGSKSAQLLTGKLLATSSHDGTIFSMVLNDVAHTIVELEQRPQYLDKDGTYEEAFIGSTIALACSDVGQGATENIKICIGMGECVVLGEQTLVNGNPLSFTGEKTTGVTITSLVVLIRASACGMTQPFSASQANTFLNNVANQMKICSYNQLVFDMSQSRIITIEFTRCDILNGCDATAIASVAWTLASAVIGSEATNAKYSHWQIVLPTGSGCDSSWAALAQIGGSYDRSIGRPTTTWFTPGGFGWQRTATVMQEILHNFGIYHSSVDACGADQVCDCHASKTCGTDTRHSEYGDYTTCMGYGDACPSGVENIRLNWATPIDILSNQNFPAGQFKDYTVFATYVGPKTVMVVKPDWTSARQFNLYFSLRMNKGGDSLLDAQFVGKVSVHSIAWQVDGRPSNENGDMHLLQVLGPNSQHDFTLYGMQLRVVIGALKSDDSISMSFCRYVTSANSECVKGGNTAFPPPSPRPPSPRPPSPPPPVNSKPPPPISISTNGRCGSSFQSTCGPKSNQVCCSKDGWCGYGNKADPLFCGSGCQLGYGYCLSDGPVFSPPVVQSPRPPPPAGSVSTDGTCGSSFGTNCGPAASKVCCSKYGYCGFGNPSNPLYCGDGCQLGFGYCLPSTTASPPPTRSPPPPFQGCPAVTYFQAYPGKTHKGDEIWCSPLQTIKSLEDACNGLNNCYSFTIDKDGVGCVKSRSAPITTDSNVLCLYVFVGNAAQSPPPAVRDNTPCPSLDYQNYHLYTNTDNPEQYTEECRTGMTISTLTNWCDSLNWCYAITLDYYNRGCVKSNSIGRFTNSSIKCFYQWATTDPSPPPPATTSSCPAVASFTNLGAQDNSYDIQCRNSQTVMKLSNWCDTISTCYAFSIDKNGRGCVKSSSYYTSASSTNICFYRYDSPTDYPPTNDPPTNDPSTNYPPTNYPPTNDPSTDYPPTNDPPTNDPSTNYPPPDYKYHDYPPPNHPRQTTPAKPPPANSVTTCTSVAGYSNLGQVDSASSYSLGCQSGQSITQLRDWCNSIATCCAFTIDENGKGCVKSSSLHTSSSQQTLCFYSAYPPPASDTAPPDYGYQPPVEN